MVSSSNVITELLQAASDYLAATNSDRFSSQPLARKIMLSNKLSSISKFLAALDQDDSLRIDQRMEVYSKVQDILERAKQNLTKQEQNLAFWETINLIQFLNLRKASLYFFDERRKVIVSANMLAEILVGIDLETIPNLPAPSNPDFRRILSILLNILSNSAGIYELAIENLQILDLESFEEWARIILDSYHRQMDIWNITARQEVKELYQKNKGTAIYLQNEIIKAFSLENLGYLIYMMEILRPSLSNSLFSHPIFNVFQSNSYYDFVDITIEDIKKIRYRIEQCVLNDSSLKIEDLPLIEDLDIILDLNLLRKKAYSVLELPSSKVSELILDWYRILNKIRRNNSLTLDWIISERGQTYLATFIEFVHLLAVEGVAEPLLVFQERWNGFSELIETIPLADYTSLFQTLTLIELYVRLHHEDYSSLEHNFQIIWRIRNEVELNLTLFVENNILQCLLGFYTNMLSESQIEELIKDTTNLVKDVMPGKSYVNDLLEYLENFLKVLNGEEASFEKLSSKRIQINDLDPSTWLIPDFQKLAKAKGKPYIPFIPFNRKKDKFYRIETPQQKP